MIISGQGTECRNTRNLSCVYLCIGVWRTAVMVISAITKNKFSSVAASDIPVVRRFRGALTQRPCLHFILSSSAVLSFFCVSTALGWLLWLWQSESAFLLEHCCPQGQKECHSGSLLISFHQVSCRESSLVSVAFTGPQDQALWPKGFPGLINLGSEPTTGMRNGN